jgi:hypothetical protein
VMLAERQPKPNREPTVPRWCKFWCNSQAHVIQNSEMAERAGFDLPSLCKVLNNLILQLNSNDSKDLKSLVDLLFLHDFLLSQT